MTAEQNLDAVAMACDKRYLDQHYLHQDSLDILAKHEVISKEEVLKYIQAQEDLYYGLRARLAPDTINPDFIFGLREIAITIAGTATGLVAGIVASVFAEGYAHNSGDALPILCGLGGGVLAGIAAGICGYRKSSKKYRAQMKNADTESLQALYKTHNACLDELWDQIKTKRTKTGELGEALAEIKEYVKEVRERFAD